MTRSAAERCADRNCPARSSAAAASSRIAAIGLKDVRHARGDVEGDRDVGGGGLPREADRVVEEHLVRSGLDDQRRQAGQVGEDRADQAERGVLPRRVVGDTGPEGFRVNSGSASRLVSMLVPARVRSAYGDMTKAAAGSGSP